MYKIIKKDITPNGVSIQLEDWSGKNSATSPHLRYGLIIAAYPAAVRPSDLIKVGETFRLQISYNPYAGYSNEMVQSDYSALVSGQKRLEDLASHFDHDELDRWRLGMEPNYVNGSKEPGNRIMLELRTLDEQDAILEQLWAALEDVPMDPDTEKLEESFYIFPVGTEREEIWHWFDKRYSKGIAHLLYHSGDADHTDIIAKMTHLYTMCIECESKDCVYNHDGECRYAFVHERTPVFSDENGCESGEILG